MIERSGSAKSSRREFVEQSVHIFRSELVEHFVHLCIGFATREELSEKSTYEQEGTSEEEHQEYNCGHEQTRTDPKENVRDIVHFR